MTTAPVIRTPTHLSHSSLEALRCAKQYFLTRLTDAPQQPALWLAGGSAVHETTEAYDLWTWPPDTGEEFPLADYWEGCFNGQLAEAYEREEDERKWRSSQSEPIEVWRTMGLQFVQAYIDWRERSPWQIWTTPAGEPAIELDVSGKLPGCEIEIKAFLDRVFWDPVMKKLVIVDLKTSKRPPKTPAQFETYAALLKVKYGLEVVHLGVPFMNRKAALGTPFDLSEVTPEAVGEIYGAAWDQIKGYLEVGNFPADTSDCFLCDVKSSCHAQGGPLARLYDPASPGYAVPY